VTPRFSPPAAATTQPPAPLAIGVINPFALAELRSGQRVDWRTIGDRAAYVEQALGFPYSKLFDPANGSPLYPGLRLEGDVAVRVAVDGPVPGGECAVIAALAAVAWARPYVLEERNRANNGGDLSEMVERLERTCVTGRTNDAGDEPQMPAITGSDPVAATSQLTGLMRTYYWCELMAAFDIWQTVRANSKSYKTFNPMTAWTYATSDSAVGRVYESANLVANHAYTILGWGYVDGEQYVVLRNPWATTEATAEPLNGSWVAWNAAYRGAPGSYPPGGTRGFWRSIPVANDDGVFGLRADAFKLYFQGLGVAK
jgi:calpain family cysteine protease